MNFSPDQIKTLEMLFSMTPAQRKRLMQLAMQSPKALQSPAISHIRKEEVATPLSVSEDSSCTETSSQSSTSTRKRVHSKNRINRLTRKLCSKYLNSERIWSYVYGSNNRIIEYRLDEILRQITADLSIKEQKTFKTYRDYVMKDLKKKMAADRRYRLKSAAAGRTMPPAPKAAVIDLSILDDDYEPTNEDVSVSKKIKRVKVETTASSTKAKEAQTTDQPEDTDDVPSNKGKPEERDVESTAESVSKVTKGTKDDKTEGESALKDKISTKATRALKAKAFKEEMIARRNSRKQKNKKTCSKARGVPRKRPRPTQTTSNSNQKRTRRGRARRQILQDTPKEKTVKEPNAYDESLLGVSMARKFGDDLYDGKVTKVYKDKEGLFEVTYSDGDKEDMDREELTYAIQLYEATPVEKFV